MTNDEVKQWLNRARGIDKEISALLDARDIALARCLSITTHPQKAKVQGYQDQRGDAARIKYLTLEEKLDRLVDALCDVKSEILDVVGRVGDGTLRTLLIERYINLKTWERVAVDMGYSWKQMHRLHGKALGVVKDDIEGHTLSVL